MLKVLLCILAGVSLASGYCPRDKIFATGVCSFRITCINTIRNITLPSTCLEATNYPVIVQVTLKEAIDRFDSNTDIGFLSTITSLRISAKWKETSLAILQYTTKLKTLYLANLGLENISGSPFFGLSRLEDLNLACNKLTDITGLFQFAVHPNKLRRLNLAYNAIDDISGLEFEELFSLTELDLSYNLISDLTEEPFYNLTKLEILKLNNNRIKDLNGALNNLLNLKHLYLRGNQIQNVEDKSLSIIEHLETFDVSSNSLELIKPKLFSRHWEHFANHSVCKIILSDNYISSVPNGTSQEISSRFVRNLDKHTADVLTELDLSVNSITSIEYNAFQSLINVVSLNLSKNKLIDFVLNPNDLAHVKYLNLSSNYISHLYFESFSLMNNLRNLDLSYNRLDFIPDMTFNSNYNLQLVNMTFNEIKKLDSIHITMFHSEGGVLDLSNNGLFKIKVPNGEGLRLFTLLLHSNNIADTSLVDLSQQTELQTLDLSRNLIGDLNVSSLLLPLTLVTLDISWNKIQQIGPSTFHLLSRLNTLRLGHNHLAQIEYGTFEGLSALQNLDLSYNRISFLDSKLLTDLKHLQVLSVRSNDMNSLDYESWYGHKFELRVYVDNNNLTCEWLGRALSDYNHEFSKMKPVVLLNSKAKNSVDGIPCMVDDSAPLKSASSQTDERLLMTSHKILEAIREQNYYLRKFMWRELIDKSEKSKS